MAVALSKFFPYVIPHVPGCSDPFAEQVVRSACIEFCSATLLLQEISTATVLAGVSDYDIDIPPASALSKVLGVMYEDRWLSPASLENVRSAVALRGEAGSAEPTSATPQVYFQKTPTSEAISLYPVPAQTVDNGLTIRAAFAPSRTATSVDDVLFDDWAEEIAMGAVSRLMQMPGQPFSAPAAQAALYRKQFDAAVKQASVLARTGQIAASSRVQPQAFA